MKFYKKSVLKDGRECIIRSCEAADGEEVLNVFIRTHAETDFMMTYPDESTFTAEGEAEFLQRKADSEFEVELCAVCDGRIVGTAGIDAIGLKDKVRHRAEFGIGIEKAYCGNGIGRLLTEACIDCAKEAGYTQLELIVVSDNTNAVSLYKSVGFVEYGRNPRGFNSRTSGYQELVLMRLELA